MKNAGLHVPRTKMSMLVHTKLEGRKRAGESPRLQGAAHRDTSSIFTQAHHTRHNTLPSHTLFRANLALTLSRMS